jgi:hypothetical protein
MLIRDCRVEPCEIKRRRRAAPAWWRAAMTVASGERAAQSAHRAQRCRLMRSRELTRDWRPSRLAGRTAAYQHGFLTPHYDQRRRSCNSFTLRRSYESQPRRRLRLPATTAPVMAAWCSRKGKDGTADDLAEAAWEVTPAHSVSGDHERGAAAGEPHLESASQPCTGRTPGKPYPQVRSTSLR